MPVSDEQIAAAIAALSPEEQKQLESALGGGGEFADVQSGASTTAPAGAPSTMGLEHAQSLSATPWYQQHPEVLGVELPSAEGIAEALPAAAATAASLLATRNPGTAGIVGGMAGEAGRQVFRRAVGAPAATGVAQQALGLDPDSPEAAVAGLGGEGAAGLAGAGASRALRAISSGASHSAERAIVRDILGGARTEREIAEAPALAKRAQAAGILRSITKRGRLGRAQGALGEARANATNLTANARETGATVEAGPVISAIEGELPSRIPGSGAPRLAATPERRAAEKVLVDERAAIVNTGGGRGTPPAPGTVRLYRGESSKPRTIPGRVTKPGTWFSDNPADAELYASQFPGYPGRKLMVDVPEDVAAAARDAPSEFVLPDEWAGRASRMPSETEVPLDVALHEIDALDDQLEAMYKRGALDPAHGKKAAEAAVTAFRTQLREALPELADARMTQHELITITKMLKRQLGEEFTSRGASGGHQAAGMAGAAAVGRYGPAGAGILSWLARTSAPLSIPARQLVAKIAAGGANTAQAWVRAADLFGLSRSTDDQISDAERHRRAQRALQDQAEGVIAP